MERSPCSEDFLAKVHAIRYAFLEAGAENGIIVCSTHSLGAGLTKQVALTNTPRDLADPSEYFSGEAALKAAGEDNTMNQF